MAQDEQVARQLIRILSSNDGICNFFPPQWIEFYRRESGIRRTVQQRDGSPDDSDVPTTVAFLSQYKHMFTYNEKPGGRCIEIRANIRLGVCKNFLQKDGVCDNVNCQKLHCCGYYLTGSCKHGSSCRGSHDLTTEHNANLLRRNLVDGLSVEDLAILIAARIPQICFPYNGNGCFAADKCRKIHICRKFIEEKCSGCNHCHDILAEQPRGVLVKYGFNVNLGPDKVLKKLRSKLAITIDERAQRNLGETTARRSQSTSATDENDAQSTNNQHGLQICSRNSSKEGCSNPRCPRLHICKNFLTSECKFGTNCKGGHDLAAAQPKTVLMKFDYDVIEDGADSVFNKLKRLFTSNNSGVESRTSGGECRSSNVGQSPDTCSNYHSKDGCKMNERCTKLHVCRHFIMGSCKFPNCYRSHDLSSKHSRIILQASGLDVVAMGTNQVREQLKTLMQASFSRSDEPVVAAAEQTRFVRPGLTTSQRQQHAVRANSRNRSVVGGSSSSIPDICPRYSYKDGCDDDSNCTQLHVCRHFIMETCKFPTCKRSHNVMSDQPKMLLIRCGLNVAAMTENQIIEKLREQQGNSRMHAQNIKSRPDQPQPSDRDNPASQVSDMKICLFNLFGRCIYKNNDCYNHHSKNNVPYQWQWNNSPDEDANLKKWTDFCPAANTELESRFCDAAEDCWRVKDDVIGGEVKINFESMTFGGTLMTGEVRRLGTDSVANAAKRNRFTTVWIWYSKTDQGLWQAFPDATKSSTATSDSASDEGIMSSHEIEFKYLTNPVARIPYLTGQGDGAKKYLLDLKQMIQTNQLTQESNRIRRRPQLYCPQEKKSSNDQKEQDSSIRYPMYWDKEKMKDEIVDYVLVDVPNSGNTADEYQKVAKRFAETMPDIPLKTIKRIQNRDLWESFDAFKTRMNRKRSPPVDPTLLFHGTGQKYVEAICQQGFDWRMCGASVGTLWGKGSYFARDASYSKSYTDCKKMFVVQVLAGDHALGNPAYVRPPPKDPNKPFQDLYDSVVNNVQNPSIYVTFEKNQSYPEYLIEY